MLAHVLCHVFRTTGVSERILESTLYLVDSKEYSLSCAQDSLSEEHSPSCQQLQS
jgi:hypothetical protein